MAPWTVVIIIVLSAVLGPLISKSIRARRRVRRMRKLERLRRFNARQSRLTAAQVRRKRFQVPATLSFLNDLVKTEEKLAKEGWGYASWLENIVKEKREVRFASVLLADLENYLTAVAFVDMGITEEELDVLAEYCRKSTPEQQQHLAASRGLGADWLKNGLLPLSIYYLIDLCLALDSVNPPRYARQLYDLFVMTGMEMALCNDRAGYGEIGLVMLWAERLRDLFYYRGYRTAFPEHARKLAGIANDAARRAREEARQVPAQGGVPEQGNQEREKTDEEKLGADLHVEDYSQDQTTLEELLAQLVSMTGLEKVKHNLHSIINSQRLDQERRAKGLPVLGHSGHLVFTGNPGTGKTTVARLLARIYAKLGLLSRSRFLEVSRSQLVGIYLGQTAPKVRHAVSEAKGGILFIDEAYALSIHGDQSNDYGREAIAELVKGIEDFREDLVVIVAGYFEPMKGFIHDNQGLQSRFTKFVSFEDYTPGELMRIMEIFCRQNGMVMTEEAAGAMEAFLKRVFEARGRNFANGRTVRNFFEQALGNQANRLAAQPGEHSVEDLRTLTLADIQALAELDAAFKEVPKATGF